MLSESFFFIFNFFKLLKIQDFQNYTTFKSKFQHTIKHIKSLLNYILFHMYLETHIVIIQREKPKLMDLERALFTVIKIQIMEYVFNSTKLTMFQYFMTCWIEYLKTSFTSFVLQVILVEYTDCQMAVVFDNCFSFYISI